MTIYIQTSPTGIDEWCAVDSIVDVPLRGDIVVLRGKRLAVVHRVVEPCVSVTLICDEVAP